MAGMSFGAVCRLAVVERQGQPSGRSSATVGSSKRDVHTSAGRTSSDKPRKRSKKDRTAALRLYIGRRQDIVTQSTRDRQPAAVFRTTIAQ
jgi:hypothetical protein